jgi:hypothetical protein
VKSRIFFLVFAILVWVQANAQKTELSGKITEKGTGIPVPYANIIFSGTYVGVMSDINGNFSLVTAKPAATIEISAVGYTRQVLPVKINQKNFFNIELAEEVVALHEIKILPGENPANILFRKIILNKDENNPAHFPSWQSRIYAKTEIDVKNVNGSLRNKKLLSQFDFVFDYIDSLELEGKTFLPVFFNETVSNYYHDRESGKDREEIIANQASGMTVDMFSQYTGKMYESINVFDNYIMVSDLGLVSPLNKLGLQFYRYYLLDSAIVDGHKIYEMSFRPKLPQEPTFKGKFWVEDQTFAITRLEMQLAEKANVNFVNNLQYAINLQKNNGKWVPRDESMIIDVDVQKDKDSEKIGLMARKTNVFGDFRFGPVSSATGRLKEPITVLGDAMKKDAGYWENIRPVELQKREQNIYQMVDSIKNVKLYKTATEYIYMFYYGYRDLGKVELGPYYYMYSRNKVEGNRFRLGARTTYKFNPKLRLNGYGAYGTMDEKWKFGGGFEYYFGMKPLSMVSVQYQHDMEMLGKSDNAFMEENIMTTLLSKQLNQKLSMVDRFELTVRHEWRVGLMNELRISATKLNSAPFVPFIDQQGNPVPSIRTGEIKFSTRYAPGEDIVVDNFERNAYANYDPVLSFDVTGGIKGFLGGGYNYLRLHAGISDRVPLNPIGYTNYYLQAGKIWGNVPFPLLKIHEGNETYAYDVFAFNLMDYQEFISNEYVSLFLEHHFQGFFLNKIPLFRKLKWREIVGVRMLKGDFDETKHNSLVLPGEMKGLGKTPYTEFSAGLENIFKIIRVDAVWRYNYNDRIKNRLGVLFSLQITL